MLSALLLVVMIIGVVQEVKPARLLSKKQAVRSAAENTPAKGPIK